MVTHPEQHEMQIMEKYPSGTEVWYCPVCGRKFLLDWPPEYKKIILEIGDESAIHTGGKGGLNMSSTKIGKATEPELPEAVRTALDKILEKFDPEDPSVDSDQMSND